MVFNIFQVYHFRNWCQFDVNCPYFFLNWIGSNNKE